MSQVNDCPDSHPLSAVDVGVYFDGVRAVDGVTLTLRTGEILGLIGPNGAGKTTFLNALTGFVPLTAGRITNSGVDVSGWSPRRLSRLGIARTFQDVRMFRALTVSENIEVGALGSGLSRRAARSRVGQVLDLMRLSHLADKIAGAIAQGDERRVGIARAVAASPRFLLLDEPGAGLNERESTDLAEVIASISDYLNCGTLVVDHDMRLIMGVCTRIHVLDSGRTISEGHPDFVRHDPAVITAYLGSEAT